MKARLIEEIERLNLVKDVNVDLSYKRALLGGAFQDGKKRPGKMFTSMSFNDGEYYQAATSNSTINWGRHLLMQVLFQLVLFNELKKTIYGSYYFLRFFWMLSGLLENSFIFTNNYVGQSSDFDMLSFWPTRRRHFFVRTCLIYECFGPFGTTV